MSGNTAEYTLKLHDEFSHGMHEAKEHADALHHSMEHLKEIVGEVIAAYYGFEVLKESLGEFELHQEAVASLSIMYKNNSEYIHENIEQLKELAEVQENLTGIHSEDTMAAEQNLMKFRDLKIGYEEMIPVIEDFAKATKTDAADAANTFGRALENPERAMRLLMQAGIGPRQIQFIRNLQQAGRTAEAQQEIFEALKDKYHGVAQAMFEANPLTQIEIQFKQTKEVIGELEDKLLKELMPIIKGTAEYVQDLVHWLEHNKETVKQVAEVVGILIAGYISWHTWVKAVEIYEKVLAFTIAAKNIVMEVAAGYSMAMAEGYTVLESAQWSLNAAMDANPIGAIILALTLLAGAVYAVVTQYEKLRKEYEAGINDRVGTIIKQEKEHVDKLAESYVKLGMSIEEARKKAIEKETSDIEAKQRELDFKIKQNRKDSKDEHAKGDSDEYDPNKIQKLDEDYNDWSADNTNYAAKLRALREYSKEKDEIKGKAEGDKAYTPIKDKTEKVSGNKQVIINVSIAKMIGVDKFIGTSKQVVMEAGEQVEKLLLGSVNQFQASIDT